MIFFRAGHKRHPLGFQILHGFEDFGTVELVEPRNKALHVVQLAVLVVFPNQEFANAFCAWDITADEEFVFANTAIPRKR